MRRWAPALVVAALAAGVPALAAPPNDPFFSRQWGLQAVGAPSAWDRATGAGVVIAVVDTGVDLDHEDLKAKLVPGYDFVDGDTVPQDENGHGTHVAGIAAAATGNRRGVAGMAPGARIMPVRVMNRFGNNLELSPELVTDVSEGIRWAVDHGAQVINLSIGSPASLGPSPFVDALGYAWSRNVVCVVAAGNDNRDSGYRNEPALVVAATDRDNQKASYSNTVGLARWGIAAPGGADRIGDAAGDIYSTYFDSIMRRHDDYAYLAGTSMAAPFVAGAVALLLERGLSPLQAVERLLATARPVGPKEALGAGLVDAARAVGLATASPAPSAPPPAASSGPGARVRGTASTPALRSPTAGDRTASPPPATGAESEGTPPPEAATAAPQAAAGAREGGSAPLWPLAGLGGALVALSGGAWLAARLRRP